MLLYNIACWLWWHGWLVTELWSTLLVLSSHPITQYNDERASRWAVL